jgi:hypothetical protein
MEPKDIEEQFAKHLAFMEEANAEAELCKHARPAPAPAPEPAPAPAPEPAPKKRSTKK